MTAARAVTPLARYTMAQAYELTRAWSGFIGEDDFGHAQWWPDTAEDYGGEAGDPEPGPWSWIDLGGEA